MCPLQLKASDVYFDSAFQNRSRSTVATSGRWSEATRVTGVVWGCTLISAAQGLTQTRSRENSGKNDGKLRKHGALPNSSLKRRIGAPRGNHSFRSSRAIIGEAFSCASSLSSRVV